MDIKDDFCGKIVEILYTEKILVNQSLPYLKC